MNYQGVISLSPQYLVFLVLEENALHCVKAEISSISGFNGAFSVLYIWYKEKKKLIPSCFRSKSVGVLIANVQKISVQQSQFQWKRSS